MLTIKLGSDHTKKVQVITEDGEDIFEKLKCTAITINLDALGATTATLECLCNSVEADMFAKNFKLKQAGKS